MTICIGSRANQTKVSKWLLFENYMSEWLKNKLPFQNQVRMTKKLICHTCIFILNMKFLWLSIAKCVLTTNQRKVQTGCHFTAIGQNYSKSNQYILHMYIFTPNIKFLWLSMQAGEQIKEKVSKCLSFESYKSESLNIWCAYTRPCVHIYTKYEVSMSNHVARRTVHTWHWRRQWHQHRQWHRQRQTKHDCIGSLVDKPNEPKNVKVVQLI